MKLRPLPYWVIVAAATAALLESPSAHDQRGATAPTTSGSARSAAAVNRGWFTPPPAAATPAPVPQTPAPLVPPPTYAGKNAKGTFGSIERMDPGLDALIAPGTQLELLANGFQWSEGPTWLWREKAVVFSDVPQNTAYKWTAKDGIRVFLKPSGYTGSQLEFKEPGSNGLTVGPDGSLVLCQHGDRRISKLTAHGFEPIVQYYEYKKFNSPNDLTYDRQGNLYFTDPPYGLTGLNQSPLKEIPWNGVYLRRTSGEVVLLTKAMTFPNGLALSPDEKTLYVGQSDENQPVIMAFPVKADGTLADGRVFFDAAPYRAGRNGVPDGMKVDARGNLFATGPSGVMVINPEGKLLGILNTGGPTGNLCWGDDGSTLYITADKNFGRIHTRTRGAGFR